MSDSSRNKRSKSGDNFLPRIKKKGGGKPIMLQEYNHKSIPHKDLVLLDNCL